LESFGGTESAETWQEVAAFNSPTLELSHSPTAIQSAMRIAYQGEPGAFSEAAARQVKADAELVPCRGFEDVFESVKAGPAAYGVLPIENTIGGSIHRNFDLLLENHLPIVGEIELPVVHNLLRTLSGVEVIATYDTAGSAKLIAEQKMSDAAAIASARAAEVFGLNALRTSIQDYEHNVTRFLIIGRRPLSDVPPDKTTLVFTLPNEPGALFKALSVFALRGLDLTKLESRPIPGRKWEYLFYADLSAARDDLKCTRALSHLAEFAPMLRVLGSYPSYKPAPADTPAAQKFESLA